jgi:hypothetical protein
MPSNSVDEATAAHTEGQIRMLGWNGRPAAHLEKNGTRRRGRLTRGIITIGICPEIIRHAGV